jgi:hypothetical protein
MMKHERVCSVYPTIPGVAFGVAATKPEFARHVAITVFEHQYARLEYLRVCACVRVCVRVCVLCVVCFVRCV